MSVTFERVVSAVEHAGSRVTGEGRQRMATCPVPAHEDSNPSLHITDGMERTLLYCHGPCATDEVLAAIGLSMRDLFDEPRESPDADEWTPWRDRCPCSPIARYSYTDELGELLFQVVRGAHKEFSQRRPDPSSRSGWRWHLDDTRRVLFHLPQLLAAPRSACIFVVEGEKDVLALEAAGEIATCNPGGALDGKGKKSWQPEWTEALAGQDVLIVADKDAAGKIHAQHVAEGVDGHVRFWWIVQAAEGCKDAYDHLAAGYSVTEFAWWSE